MSAFPSVNPHWFTDQFTAGRNTAKHELTVMSRLSVETRPVALRCGVGLLWPPWSWHPLSTCLLSLLEETGFETHYIFTIYAYQKLFVKGFKQRTFERRYAIDGFARDKSCKERRATLLLLLDSAAHTHVHHNCNLDFVRTSVHVVC